MIADPTAVAAPPNTPKPTDKKVAGAASKGLQKTSQAMTDAGNKTLERAEAQTAEGPKMYHDGGVVDGDDQHILAEKGETVLPNHDKGKALDLAVEHLKGMSDGMSTKAKKKDKVEPMSKEKHEAKHETKKDEKKKAHGFHARKVNGGWHIHHHDESGKPIEGAEHVAADMDGLHDHMEDHFGEPNQGEPEADAGQHGVPEPQASAAGLPPMPGQGV